MARLLFLLVLLLAGAQASADEVSSLVNARRAQAALGPEIWSEVVRLDHRAPAGRPLRVLHALVFELAGILWVYSDDRGTQSLSLAIGRLAADKADLTPLLRKIDPGLMAWKVVPDSEPAPAARAGDLPMGCFIESLAALRARRERGETALNARLLSIYFDPDSGRPGHTVLVYYTERGVEVIDPNYPKRAQRFSPERAGDARALAQALVAPAVAQARWVPVDSPLGPVRLTGDAVAGGTVRGDAATRML